MSKELDIRVGSTYEDALGQQVKVTWIGTNGMISFNRISAKSYNNRGTLHRSTFEKVYTYESQKKSR